jgi:NAD(P)-dependent dehydrogenase (short-subunit alcohol dehydrogenase family)
MGVDVVVVSSNPDRIQKAVQSLGGRVEGQTADLSDERAVAALFTRLGPIDHLVFTAGDSLQLLELAGTDFMEARRAFELRYWSALAAVKYASPHIRKGGSIVPQILNSAGAHKGWWLLQVSAEPSRL